MLGGDSERTHECNADGLCIEVHGVAQLGDAIYLLDRVEGQVVDDVFDALRSCDAVVETGQDLYGKFPAFFR